MVVEPVYHLFRSLVEGTTGIEAERHASGAANGRSEVRAEAIGGRLQANVRPGSASAVAPPPAPRRPVVAHPKGMCNRRKLHSIPTPFMVFSLIIEFAMTFLA